MEQDLKENFFSATEQEAEQQFFAIVPRGLWVLIRNEQTGERVSNGVVLPEGQSKSQRGMVVAVSTQITDLEVGDLVVYTAFPIELPDIEELTGEKNLHLVRSEEVFAVAKPKD